MFRNIFSEFFRRGDVEHYADLVFNAINTSQGGFITFPVNALFIVSILFMLLVYRNLFDHYQFYAEDQ
jgi:hypothetical protein